MIDATFFTDNRSRLLEQLPDLEVVVLTGYSAMQLTGDAGASFRQESNFWYLTGIDEPDWLLVLTRKKAWLVAPDVSEVHRVFEGGSSPEAARDRSGVDDVIGVAEAKTLLDSLSSRHAAVGSIGKDPYARYYSFSLNPTPGRLHRRLGRLFREVVDVRQTIARLRAIKQPAELAAIRQAVDLTVQSFAKAHQSLGSLQYEYETEALFSAEFRRHNAYHAYEPIVAGGMNACTLHYIKNNAAYNDPSLVLIDIGAWVDGYAADITRTYAFGQPTVRQAAIHAAVLDAQQQVVGLLQPGLSMHQYQQESDRIMAAALREVDLLRHEDEYRQYFPHAMSHGLGVDVHDSLGGYEEFRPGMVVTVEPGIYIPQEAIGVRLEDDILITETGHENLSQALPLGL